MGIIKKIKLMPKLLGLVIVFMLFFSSSINVFAKEVNLNDPSWKVYNDINGGINYLGNWDIYGLICGNKSRFDRQYYFSESPNCKAEFNFIGTKLQVITQGYDKRFSSNVLIRIDNNIVDRFSSTEASGKDPYKLCVVYEKTNLANKKHHVEIITQDSNYFNISAIAIDRNGVLVSDPKVRPLLSKNSIKENDIFATDIILDDGINICAEDLMVSYDKNLFEYIGYEKVNGINQCRVGVDRDLGKVRCLIAHNKIDYISYTDDTSKNIIRLKFLAKKDGKGKISVINGITKGSSGIKNNILNDNCKSIDVNVNKSDDGGLGDLGDLGNIDDF